MGAIIDSFSVEYGASSFIDYSNKFDDQRRYRVQMTLIADHDFITKLEAFFRAQGMRTPSAMPRAPELVG